LRPHANLARWQSGHAAACKAVYAGSIPTLASNSLNSLIDDSVAGLDRVDFAGKSAS
jgi:hypothetical protein